MVLSLLHQSANFYSMNLLQESFMTRKIGLGGIIIALMGIGATPILQQSYARLPGLSTGILQDIMMQCKLILH